MIAEIFMLVITRIIKRIGIQLQLISRSLLNKKSHETKLNSFKNNSLALSAEQQFASFMKNEKQYLINPYFSTNTDFSKSFGSSIYNPVSSESISSGKKLAALKNCLVMNTYSNKNAEAKSSSYMTTKAMKKIEKKSIKYAMKNQNLSFNDKPNVFIKTDKLEEGQLGTKKKRSVSPMTKNLVNKYNYSTTKSIPRNGKSKSRSGSRKTNMKSPNAMRKC